jgi:hypothetical protein
MSGVIDRLERDVNALEEAIATLATEVQRAYSSYLTALSQAVRQQLILASFHLCTQGYPQAFLKLSRLERERLQQALRQQANAGQQQLVNLLSEPVQNQNAWVGEDFPEAEVPETEVPEAEVQDVSIAAADTADATDTTDEDTHTTDLTDVEVAAEQTENSLTELFQLSLSASKPTPLTPDWVVAWQKQVEVAIADTLQSLSHQTNHILQSASILPQKLPDRILEGAKAEATESISSIPNILNLLVEVDGGEQLDKSQVMQILAIHLRLPEIEFAEAGVGTWRTQIRQLSQRFNNLAQDYDRKCQELAIARAEMEWRSSWFED